MSDDLRCGADRGGEGVVMDDLEKRLRANALDECDEAIARIEELEAENHLLKTSGIIEVAVRNPNVMEYMRHWEGRAAAAEAALEKAMKIAEDYEGNEDRNSYSVSRFIYELKGENDE